MVTSDRMTVRPTLPPLIVLTSAVVLGVLLALAVHILAVRIGLDLGSLWVPGPGGLMPASAAAAWWLVAAVALVGGYATAAMMDDAASARVPPRLRQILIAAVVAVLAAAGGAASGAGPVPTAAGVIAGLAALGLGATMAFCGASFALRRR